MVWFVTDVIPNINGFSWAWRVFGERQFISFLVSAKNLRERCLFSFVEQNDRGFCRQCIMKISTSFLFSYSFKAILSGGKMCLCYFNQKVTRKANALSQCENTAYQQWREETHSKPRFPAPFLTFQALLSGTLPHCPSLAFRLQSSLSGALPRFQTSLSGTQSRFPHPSSLSKPHLPAPFHQTYWFWASTEKCPLGDSFGRPVTQPVWLWFEDGCRHGLTPVYVGPWMS